MDNNRKQKASDNPQKRKPQSKTIKVAFSGSGFLAPTHAGFACGLMDLGYKIIEVAGTSGGSIVAALIASGANQARIKKIVFDNYPDNIVEKSNWTMFNAIRRKQFYINDGKVLENYLYENLGETNFYQTRIPLTIMATNLTDNETIEFSRTKTPGVKLHFAARASSSVPYIYKPVNYEGKILVDGGERNNIPTDKLTPGGLRVGVRILDGGNYDVSNIIGFSKQNINCLLDANEDNLVSWAKATGAKIAEIKCDPYDFLDARINLEGKKDLFDRGYKAAQKLING